MQMKGNTISFNKLHCYKFFSHDVESWFIIYFVFKNMYIRGQEIEVLRLGSKIFVKVLF